ncbi:MAG: hypothetical protein IJQ12_04555 [Lachnospiraceae bacterium]|nr:hypothetical protein [Lachnospiraceae bacterium]
MTNVMLCLGARAAHPYEWEALGVRISSIEEMCFYIVRNRYLLGADAFTPALADWIEKELALPELALAVRRRLEAGSPVAEFAVMILDYVRYNPKEEIEETKRVLKDNTEMDIYEKHLARADFLIESEHFHQALDVYEGLRRMTGENDKDRQARVLKGKGAMNARMFSFSEAAMLYLEAYELTGDPDAYLKYLAALRMKMSEKEYLDYIAQDQAAYQLSMRLEALISEAEEGFGKSAGYEKVRALMQLKSQGRMNEYYEMAQQMITELKDAYRGAGDVAARR